MCTTDEARIKQHYLHYLKKGYSKMTQIKQALEKEGIDAEVIQFNHLKEGCDCS